MSEKINRVDSIVQVTEHKHLNFFELTARKPTGKCFPYYVASRSRSPEELYMNNPEKKPDGVVIYSLYGEKKDKVVLIRQFRYPVNDYVYEFPAGLVENGEDFHTAAQREMKEETGLDFTGLPVHPAYEKAFFTTDGMTDERCSMVYGYAQGTVSREGLEESEDIEVILADRKEAARILKEEQVALMCAYMLMHFIADGEDPFAFLTSGQIEGYH